jgi:hypothetical protein
LVFDRLSLIVRRTVGAIALLAGRGSTFGSSPQADGTVPKPDIKNAIAQIVESIQQVQSWAARRISASWKEELRIQRIVQFAPTKRSEVRLL